MVLLKEPLSYYPPKKKQSKCSAWKKLCTSFQSLILSPQSRPQLLVQSPVKSHVQSPVLSLGYKHARSSVWSTKTFLYDIRELRYQQNNMGYQISRILINSKSNIVKSDTAAIYASLAKNISEGRDMSHIKGGILKAQYLFSKT